MYPKISIITPSYNQGEYIEETIKSVLSQNYPNLEYLIIDGGSTDNTIEIVKKYSDKIKWISAKDSGQTNAINKGIRMSTGEIIGFLNSDDVYLLNTLLTVGNLFKTNKILNFIYGIGIFINKDGRRIKQYDSFNKYVPIDKTDTYSALFHGCFISQPTAFWKRKLMKNVGYFEERLHFAFDYEYWIRVSKKTQMFYFPIELACTRLHSETKTFLQKKKVFMEMAQIQLKYYKKVHYGIIFNLTELELLKYKKDNFFSKSKYLLLRIRKSFGKYIQFNHSLPPLRIYYYYFIWIKEIFIEDNSFEDKIVKKSSSFLKLFYYLFFKNKDFINRLILIFTNNKYIEIGNLKQHRPIKAYQELFPKNRINKHYKISIVTPSYNQARFIKETIKSVLDQNYPNLEYIIQDAQSTDGTQQIIKKYVSQLSHYESKKDRGHSNGLNIGFKHTSGEIMAYLNSDDLLMKGSLDYINYYFQTHPDVDIIYGHRIIINQKSKQIGRWILYKHNNNVAKYADYIPQETMFWRKRIWEKVGAKINEDYKFAMDWELIFRFIKAGAKIVRIPYVIGAFRVHDKSRTKQVMETVGIPEWNRLFKKYHGKLITEEVRHKMTKNYIIKSSFTSFLFDKGIRI